MTALLLIVLALYGAVSGYLILLKVNHRVLALLAIQYGIVLPVAIYFLRRSRQPGEWQAPPRAAMIGAAILVVLLAAAIGIYIYPGVTVPDESAYQFQARVFASGKMYAEPLPVPVRFEHHIVHDGKWFAKYPPGWPAILALGVWLHALPLINPLLGAALAAVTFVLARRIFDARVASLALFFLVLSPYFLANIAGTMSHTSCALAVTLAGYFCLRGLDDLRLGNFAASFAMAGVACQIRPLSGLAACVAVGCVSLFAARRRPRLLLGVLVTGAAAAALAVGAMLAVNRYYTGSPFVSPYTVAGAGPSNEFAANLSEYLRNFVTVSRWGVLRTVLYTVPFAFLLAGYALVRVKAKRPAIVAAVLPFLLVVIFYNIESEGSGSFNGDRYFFEAFPLLAIAAARGLALLLERWRPAPAAVTTLLCAVAALQVWQHAIALPVVTKRSYVTRQVRKHVPGSPRVIFLKGPEEQAAFIPKHANWNDPDWRHADHVYLVDPGPLDRASWAKRFGEASWKVLGYDSNTASVSVEVEPR